MILDADVIIDLLRHHPNATAWLATSLVPPAISDISALEVLYGAQNSAGLRRVERFLSRFPIEWPTAEDTHRASLLAPLHLSDGIGVLDAITAAIALRRGDPVATFNTKHFRPIPGLLTVQP